MIEIVNWKTTRLFRNEKAFPAFSILPRIVLIGLKALNTKAMYPPAKNDPATIMVIPPNQNNPVLKESNESCLSVNSLIIG